jgi:hypothetical protein
MNILIPLCTIGHCHYYNLDHSFLFHLNKLGLLTLPFGQDQQRILVFYSVCSQMKEAVVRSQMKEAVVQLQAE